MGKSKSTAEGKQPTGKEIRIPSKGTIKSFESAKDSAAETIDDAKKELQDAIDIAKKGHLEVAPFNLAKKLHDDVHNAKNQGIAIEKLARWLAHFDEYRKHFKLDELANLQGRMFGEGEIGGNPEEPPREADEDGEPDMRPNHLRQPGASAAAHVQQLAAKAGVTPRPDDEQLKNVGRGPDLKPGNDDKKLH